jgi:membrane protein implicated in regulation of membrane protease activity
MASRTPQPGREALGLRLGLASLGFVLCVAIGVGVLVAGGPVWFPIVLFVVALTALVDMLTIRRRISRRHQP